MSGAFLFRSLYDLIRQRREVCVQGGVSERRDAYRQGSYGRSSKSVKNKDIDLRAVSTHDNLSDVCAKPVSQELCRKHMLAMGQRTQAGRSETAKRSV